MKKNKLFLCALASGMLALTGCSESTDFTESEGAPHWNADGTGYVSLAINLPQTNTGGRAENSDNDQFNDGTPSEYAVNNAILVLFTGTAGAAESTYNFAAAYQLPVTFNMNNPEHDEITSTAKITKKIQSFDISNDIKALVILNAPSAIVCGNDKGADEAANNTLTVNGTQYTTTKTFGDFAAEVAELGTAVGNFMMTNAPLSTAQSSTSAVPRGTISVLAPFNKGNIRGTSAEAELNTASEIFVERSVAKVELTTTKADNTFEVVENTTSGNKIQCQIVGYELDNTNTKSYLVRNTEGFGDWLALRSGSTDVQALATGYRFVGSDKVGNYIKANETDTPADLYRTYFAKDINYTGTQGSYANDYNLNTTPTGNFEGGLESPRYCLENTFDVAGQIQKNTTRAVIKVKYTKNNQALQFMYGTSADNFYENKDGLEANLKEVVANNALVQVAHGSTVGTSDISDFTYNVTFDELTASGTYELTSFKVGSTVYNNESASDAVKAAFNNVKDIIGKISYFKDGEGYYAVLIKHFGDTLTPWNTWEIGTEKPAEGSAYPGTNADQNYLGRYGVLRNNWYQLSVSAIKRIGTPVIPTPNDNTDDQLDSYINVKIDVLSWAVRKQDVTLGE